MRRHSSGQARVTLAGKTHYLGAWGSPEAHERYVARTRSRPDDVRAIEREWRKRVREQQRKRSPKSTYYAFPLIPTQLP
jgi:hypothetical protein